MPGEVKFTPYGIPYVVEFANVSIYPRMPVTEPAPLTIGCSRTRLTRSNTSASAPAARTHKPLPSLPEPVRSASLRLFPSKSKSSSSSASGMGDAPGSDDQRKKSDRRRNAVFLSSIMRKQKEEYEYQTAGTILAAVDVSSLQASASEEHFSSSETTLVQCPDPSADAHPEGKSVTEGLSKRAGGLYIRFPNPSETETRTLTASSSSSSCPRSQHLGVGSEVLPTTKTPEGKLRRLSRTIADAVVAAGMDTPGSASARGGDEEKARPGMGERALFRGTYGQVRAAFRAAGLVTMPCQESGFAQGAVSVLVSNVNGLIERFCWVSFGVTVM
ncbi:hypothetical protein EW146_g291 [Bondarzewia mesenterica]|uniref:Uncharacterized protein n=1 Tax=Bondarzewia mesenterica TaxID=1095465 RepID=A0A4S4M7C9_9AGAM|nr:hypothetical protein EW146_g291 [Bondarzewia mesenterica]